MVTVHRTRPIAVIPGSLPPTADGWIRLFRSRHRLHPATELATLRLWRALSDGEPRASVNVLAREIKVERETLGRLLRALQELGAFEASVEINAAGPQVTYRGVWPPRRGPRTKRQSPSH